MSEVTESEIPTIEVKGAADFSARQEAWDKHTSRIEVTPDAPEAPAAEVITKADVAGNKPSDPEAVPDRALVAPQIAEFIREQAPAPQPTGLEAEIQDLKAALQQLKAPATAEEASLEQQTLSKLEALEAREAAREAAEAEAREQEAYENRVRAMKDGVVENIRSRKEDFPGLLALEQEETVFNALVQRLQEGTETSEDEVASEVEGGLRTVYETLHKVYGTTSKAPAASESQRTLSTALEGADEPVDLDSLSPIERRNAIWRKHSQ
jgi:hypothetical protein